MLEWYSFALFGMLSFSVMSLALKKLTFAVSTPVILFYLFVFAAVMNLAFALFRREPIAIEGRHLGWLVFAAVAAFFGNICDVQAIKGAPNVGYASAIKSGQIVVLTIASILLFPGQRVGATGVIGISMVVGGIALLVLNQGR